MSRETFTATVALLRNLCAATLPATHTHAVRASTTIEPVALEGQVDVLDSPTEYYEAVRAGIQTAKDEIILSALYFGTGPMEKALIDDLVLALKTRPNLRVTLVFDHSRAHRLVPVTSSSPTVGKSKDHDNKDKDKGKDESTAPGYTMLQRVLAAAAANGADPNRCTVLLFQMPQLRAWTAAAVVSPVVAPLLQRQPILGEVLGVYHAKFCIFDRTCLLSGANLSEEYFLRRQDRYVRIQPTSSSSSSSSSRQQHSNSVILFLHAFLQALTPHCHSLSASGFLRPPPVDANTPHVLAAQLRRTYAAAQLQLGRPCVEEEEEEEEKERRGRDADGAHTMVLPLLQFGPAGISDESSYLSRLVQSLAHSSGDSGGGGGGMASSESAKAPKTPQPQPLAPVLRASVAMVSSPYPSFQPAFSGALGSLAKFADVNIVVPSSASHGFGTAKGIKSLLPGMHDAALESAIHTAMTHQGDAKEGAPVVLKSGAGVGGGLALWRYSRPGWSFHSKGLWMGLQLDYGGQATSTTGGAEAAGKATAATAAGRDKDKDKVNSGHALLDPLPHPPVELTYIGSSNLGARSLHRDLELGFVLVTCDPSLKAMLRAERSALLAQSQRQDEQALRTQLGGNRLSRMLARIARTLL